MFSLKDFGARLAISIYKSFKLTKSTTEYTFTESDQYLIISCRGQDVTFSTAGIKT